MNPFSLFLPAVSSWPPLAPVCTSDACGAAGLGLVAPALGLGLSSTAAGWIAAAAMVALLLLGVYIFFGAYALAGLLRVLALCGLAAVVVLGFNAWYDAAPAMVIGVLLGFTAGVVSTGAAALILFRISGGDN